jgi:hypothetical protein
LALGGLITAAEMKAKAGDHTNNKQTSRGWRGDMILFRSQSTKQTMPSLMPIGLIAIMALLMVMCV